MLANAEKIRLGSLIFVGSNNSWLSWLIKRIQRFKYSHVAVYIGMGKIIESDIGGVQINSIHRYMGNDNYYGEVVNSPTLDDDALAKFLTFLLGKYKNEYDYTAVLGHVFSRLFHRARKRVGLWNADDAWFCSELVAASLAHAGVSLKLPPSQVTPRDLYFAIKTRSEGVKNG